MITILTDNYTKNIPADIGAFASGERYCELFPENAADIVGRNIAIIFQPQNDVNHAFIDLINCAETLKAYGAATVHVAMACVPYARQDRDFGGRHVSIMNKTTAKHLHAAGIDKVTLVDIHSKAAANQYTEIFGADNVRLISALPMLQRAMRDLVPNDVTVKYGGPDGGDKPDDMAQTNARHLASLDPSPDNIFSITKRHTDKSISKVVDFQGNVTDCVVVICDDVIDTGGTIYNAAQTAIEHGAKSVIVVVNQPGFSGDTLDKYTKATVNGQPNPIAQFIVTDSMIDITARVAALPIDQQSRIKIVPIAPMLQKTFDIAA